MVGSGLPDVGYTVTIPHAAGFALREYSEDAHVAAAGVADQDIIGEHAREQVGPWEPTARGGMRLRGRGRAHDRSAEMVVRRKHAVEECGAAAGLFGRRSGLSPPRNRRFAIMACSPR